jgi:hypothetical protein
MNTTYRISSKDLSSDIIENIKKAFPNKDIIIDVYQDEKIDIESVEIEDPEIISRINDIENGNNIVIPKLNI